MLATDRFVQDMKIRLVSLKEGEAVLEMDLEERHLNGNDVAQGGVIFTLADAAFAAAVNSPERDVVTQDCAINFLRPAPLGTITARAAAVHIGRRTCCADVTVTDEKGKILAKMQGTGFVTGPVPSKQ